MPSETITVSADNGAGALQALGNAEEYGSFRLKGLAETSVMSSFADARVQDRKAISSAVAALGYADRVAAHHILSGD